MKLINHSLELEQRTLQNLMDIGVHHDSRAQKAFLNLTSDCFYSTYNAELFALVKHEFSKREGFNFVDILVLIPVDRVKLYEAFQWIMDNHRQFHVNTSNLESDVDKLITLMQLRKQVALAETTIADVRACTNPQEAQALLSENLSLISDLSYRVSKQGMTNVEIAEQWMNGELVTDTAIPTACPKLNDALNGGIRSKSLIIIAAGAGVGKTGFAIWLMNTIARAQADSESLFFSLEMELKHIWMRYVGICAGKKFELLSEDEAKTVVTESCTLPMTIYDTTSSRFTADIDYILTTSRLKAMEGKISVIVVDYLGLVQNHGTFERNDLRQADITSKLASLAIELDCTVIALSQINRGSAARANDDRCPYPHDAADSSGGHRSATLWIGIDRPELYLDDPCYKNQFVVKCRKNRFGNNFELIYAFNEGTFAAVHDSYFRKPYRDIRSPQEALFSHRG